MISVVMATYNGEKYINEQLDSILSQTVKANEIIIIDDKSTDGTFSILEKYKSKYTNLIQIYKNEINEGYIKTFYKAISKAKGKYIFLCDQDDVWEKNKIDIMISYMKTKPYMILNSNYSLIDENGKKLKEKIFLNRNFKVSFNRKIQINEILKYNVSMGCTSVITQNMQNVIVQNIDLLCDYAVPHDWMINIIAALNGKLGYINRKTIKYRLHEKNTIGLKRARSIEDRIKAYENSMLEKEQIGTVIRKMGISNEKVELFIRGMLESYVIRINALITENFWEYIRMCTKKENIKYFTLKTFLYDVLLLIRRK